jgi:hypothetical protein
MTMTERTKSWIKENVMGIILACMFTAFWVGYENDKTEDREWKRTEAEKSKKVNDRQQVISQCVYSDPDTQPYLREIIYEWIKLETRGGG